jgi:excisionase family DNA binding protein
VPTRDIVDVAVALTFGADMSQPHEPLANIEDVATYVGVSLGTVNQWLYKGVAPKSYKVGKHRRFRWSDVEAWLEQRSDSPGESSDETADARASVAPPNRADAGAPSERLSTRGHDAA